jgi:hypothetical protein
VILKNQENKTSETIWMWFRREIIGTRLTNRVKIEDIYMWLEEEEEEEEDVTNDSKFYQSIWKQRVSCRHMDCH